MNTRAASRGVALDFFDILLGVASGFLGVVSLVSAVEVWVFVHLGYWWPLKTVAVFTLIIVGIALLLYARDKIR
jgi:hypothetical protein